ncbi:unnamed protein product [Prorocentrum cordatum]|uniref:Uncharacterized protein n=1 Tax=Prorocentrum cordatum TaxID=2364126 RepID=A0ABN9U207_9DINO|nr:unnamed protein product [Polarella glacialis]
MRTPHEVAMMRTLRNRCRYGARTSRYRYGFGTAAGGSGTAISLADFLPAPSDDDCGFGQPRRLFFPCADGEALDLDDSSPRSLAGSWLPDMTPMRSPGVPGDATVRRWAGEPCSLQFFPDGMPLELPLEAGSPLAAHTPLASPGSSRRGRDPPAVGERHVRPRPAAVPRVPGARGGPQPARLATGVAWCGWEHLAAREPQTCRATSSSFPAALLRARTGRQSGMRPRLRGSGSRPCRPPASSAAGG